MTVNLIISEVHQSHLGCCGHRSENAKLEVWTMLHTRCALCAVLLKDKIVIRNVFGQLIKHLNNARHAIHA